MARHPLISHSSIHGAASLGVLDKVKAFVEKGIDVNAKDAQGMTPLHIAAQEGYREVVEFLLSSHAAVNAKDNERRTPLDLALSQRHKDVATLLAKTGADIPTIHIAASVGSLEKLRKYVKASTDVDTKDEGGQTPLLRAIKGRHIDVVKFLIEAGADVNRVDTQGYVPLVHVLWALDSDTVRLLLDKGADVQAKDASGYTPLHWAVMMGSTELTELILDAGGDVNARSKRGETALDLARQGGSEIVELLRKRGAKGKLARSPEPTPHDMAITDILALTSCKKGDTLSITVRVENRGHYNESFIVKLTSATDGSEIARKSMVLSAKHEHEANADVTFTGEAGGEQNFGDWLVVGNVNGDEYADLLVSAPLHDKRRGKAYLYYGGKSMDDNPDKVFDGETTGDCFGGGGGYLADMNNDGFDEVMIGARFFNDRGRVYLFFGGPDMDEKADIVFEPEETVIYSSFGRGMAVGDLNGDGYGDLIVSAPGSSRPESKDLKGRAYLFYGGESLDTAIDKIFIGENANDGFGAVRSARGDVDGDGFDDLIIGTRYYPDIPDNQRGRAYLYYGAPGTDMDTVCDLIFNGENDNDNFATGVDLFDIDNDGHADVIISARRWNGSQGRVYLYWGSDRANMDNIPDLHIDGEPDARATFGGDHVVAGYANDDKYGDIVVPAFDYYRFSQHGRTYLFHGGAKSSMDNICDQTFTGENPGNLIMVARIANFNGDSRGDIVTGGWGYPNRTKRGRVWLYYGGTPSSADMTFNWDTTNASIGKHTLRASIAPVEGEEDVVDNTMTVEVEVKEERP
jgi:ankyrin repeat protein